MIDIHTHILPGVDDGPSNMEESLKIIEKGMKDGIKTFVLTPHIREDSDWEKIDYIKEKFICLKRECLERSFDVQLILGAEIFLTPSLPEKLKDNPTFIIKYGSKKYVLVELPFYQYPIYTEEVLFNLLTERIIPVVAHPERYLYLERNIKIIKKWMKNEILLQINTGSLNGQYGMQVKRFARRLLKNGLVHFIGSDVHSINENTLSLSKAIKIASRLVGKDMIRPIYNSFSNGDL